MTRYAGLEIDSSTFRLAIFEGSPKEYTLVDFIEEEIRAESDEERAEMVRGILSDVLTEKANQGMEVAISLDARNVALREISVPYTRDDHIAKTIRFEAESYIHAQSIDDVVVEYLKCAENDDTSRIVLCIVPKKVLKNHLAIAQGAKIDPMVCELDATALATAFSSTPLYTGEQNVLLVELEEDYSRLVFLEGDRVVKIRSFWDRPAIRREDRLLEGGDPDPSGPTPTGGESSGAATATATATAAAGTATMPEPTSDIEDRFQEIERALSSLDHPEDSALGELGLDELSALGDLPLAVVPDEEYDRLTGLDDDVIIVDDDSLFTSEPAAEQVPTMPAPPQQEEPSEGRVLALPSIGDADPMDRVFLEIERTFAAYVMRNTIHLVVVTGPRAEPLSAASRIADHFEVEAVPFDLGDSFPITWKGDPEIINQRGAVACGLGLRVLGKGITSFDLRKDEFKFERKFEQLMPALVLSGLLLWVLALVWSFGSYRDLRLAQREVAALQQDKHNIYEAMFGEKAKGDPMASMTKKIRDLKRGGSAGGNFVSYFSAMEVISDITEAVKKATVTREGKTVRVYPVYYSIDLQPEINKNSTCKIKLRVKSNAEGVAVETALTNHLKKLQFKKQNLTQESNGEYEATIQLEVKKSILRSK